MKTTIEQVQAELNSGATVTLYSRVRRTPGTISWATFHARVLKHVVTARMADDRTYVVPQWELFEATEWSDFDVTVGL